TPFLILSIPVDLAISDSMILLFKTIPFITSHKKCVSTLPKPFDNFEVKFDISSSNLLFKAV
ncbi:MAG: hypothetical protein MR357_03865, partial [Anaeroplasma sp.]|nr:hypothetical protein [Anaeroplasma sp.]